MVRPPTVVTVDIEDLTADIQEILDEYRIPGASIALVDRGRTIWAGGVGKADLAARVDVTADHLFRIGSISKSFNALAALRAVSPRCSRLTPATAPPLAPRPRNRHVPRVRNLATLVLTLIVAGHASRLGRSIGMVDPHPTMSERPLSRFPNALRSGGAVLRN